MPETRHYRIRWTAVAEHDVTVDPETLANLMDLPAAGVFDNAPGYLGDPRAIDASDIADNLAGLDDDGFMGLRRENIRITAADEPLADRLSTFRPPPTPAGMYWTWVRLTDVDGTFRAAVYRGHSWGSSDGREYLSPMFTRAAVNRIIDALQRHAAAHPDNPGWTLRWTDRDPNVAEEVPPAGDDTEPGELIYPTYEGLYAVGAHTWNWVAADPPAALGGLAARLGPDDVECALRTLGELADNGFADPDQVLSGRQKDLAAEVAALVNAEEDGSEA